MTIPAELIVSAANTTRRTGTNKITPAAAPMRSTSCRFKEKDPVSCLGTNVSNSASKLISKGQVKKKLHPGKNTAVTTDKTNQQVNAPTQRSSRRTRLPNSAVNATVIAAVSARKLTKYNWLL